MKRARKTPLHDPTPVARMTRLRLAGWSENDIRNLLGAQYAPPPAFLIESYRGARFHRFHLSDGRWLRCGGPGFCRECNRG